VTRNASISEPRCGAVLGIRVGVRRGSIGRCRWTPGPTGSCPRGAGSGGTRDCGVSPAGRRL